MSVEECRVSGSMAKVGAKACVHKRSNSFPDKLKFGKDPFEPRQRAKLDKGHAKKFLIAKKNHLPTAQIQITLKDEIVQLEKRLQDQVCVRGALEQALGYRSSQDIPNLDSISKPATELIKEIAVLEYEVSHLEQYLLSLYRKAFDQQISCPSPLRNDRTLKPPLITPRGKYLETCRADISLQANANRCFEEEEEELEDELLDSGVQHCKSSVARPSAAEFHSKSLRACHSQPPSMMEYAHTSSNIISLAEHLGTRIKEHVPTTPNKLSEDMVTCMSAIFYKLADSPQSSHGLSSPTSSSSSMSAFSPKQHPDMMWGPGFRRDSFTFDLKLDNPFHVQGLKEFSGPYSTMVEIQSLYKDNQRLSEIEPMLQHFRSLVSRLEDVHPRKLKHDEKLAFWINVHNALVMHAVLAYGIPQNNMKRVFLLLKAAYNVGGHILSADVIQSYILGCRMSRPGQWLRMLLSSRTKLRASDERQAYAIDHQEPLLHFALCSGCHSDPAVRVYTPKRVFQELETAKEEFIRATFGVGKDQRILLPKIVESFAKDSRLCDAGVIEMVQLCLPNKLKKTIKKHHLAKLRKKIEYVPHDFTFRYLISKELVK
ncbi:ternary complex factor MIP1, leucine-zipper [Artemisia annua]|uniref:Ternary complex factor MIP1, leucine-zipper n=1 Tax=Artemisia annua TaxID=35608 RepID=A0A2U1PPH1_ARTAN|nr:ternary complex factor MIP1, leucine-zipper [Artemisia annua]